MTRLSFYVLKQLIGPVALFAFLATCVMWLTQSLRLLAAFVLLFLATLLIGSLLAIALSEIFKKIGLAWLDRWLGALFGLARGLMILSVMVLLAGLTNIPQDPRWRNAMFSAPLEALVTSALPWFPKGVATHVKY